MKSIGQVLTAHRTKLGWSVDRLSRETNVPAPFIISLEAEEFASLPTPALVQGYVQLLANALHIPQETALALLRRDLPPLGKNEMWSKSERLPLQRWRWLHPRTLSLVLLVVTVVSAGLFVGYQWMNLGRPPELAVESLENYAVVTSPLTITGHTDPKATVTVNTEIVSLDASGRFRYEITLPPGERTLVITSTDAQGRKSEAVYFVTVE
jgi:cytoskeletal protein RodZ